MVLTYSISSFPVLIFQMGMGMRLVNWSHSSAEGSGDQTNLAQLSAHCTTWDGRGEGGQCADEGHG